MHIDIADTIVGQFIYLFELSVDLIRDAADDYGLKENLLNLFKEAV